MERRSRLVNKKYNELKKKTVAIIGLGGTGFLTANLLARAGLKKLIIIDKDIIEESNLERQLFYKNDIGESKTEVLERELSFFCKIEPHEIEVTKQSISKLGIEKCDLILDCTDNMESRHIINEFCKKNKINWIYSGAIQNQGNLFFNRVNGPNIEHFLKNKYGKKAKDVGIINACATTISSILVSMALNFLVFGIIEDKLIRIDLNKLELSKIKINKNLL